MENKNKRILIISQSHICRNPRVYKEAATLSGAGYDVTILTTIYSDELFQEDKGLLSGTSIRYKLAADLRNRSFKNSTIRLRRLIHVKLVRWFKLQTPGALGYNLRGYDKLIDSNKSDIYFVHQELPLYLGCRLLKKGKKVVFDFEDWYSEDLLKEARAERPLKLLKRLERHALKYGTHVQTTSNALANALAETYESKKPSVIYNTFDACSGDVVRKDRKNPGAFSLYWFSQTLGPGRGIETIIKAIKTVKHPLELHLRGNCSQDYRDELYDLMGKQDIHKLYIHQLVSNVTLGDRIKEHDIGLAFDFYKPLSRDLTASNKIFHYLINKVPVIESPTMGHKEVAALAKGGVFVTKDFTISAV
ncbi:MAG: glycosyltransferase [Sphingobacteriales bacterium]